MPLGTPRWSVYWEWGGGWTGFGERIMQFLTLLPEVDLRALGTLYVVRHAADDRSIDQVIARSLQAAGFDASAGVEAAQPPVVEAIVEYEDCWEWHQYQEPFRFGGELRPAVLQDPGIRAYLARPRRRAPGADRLGAGINVAARRARLRGRPLVGCADDTAPTARARRLIVSHGALPRVHPQYRSAPESLGLSSLSCTFRSPGRARAGGGLANGPSGRLAKHACAARRKCDP
jgi:hypothetical protein